MRTPPRTIRRICAALVVGSYLALGSTAPADAASGTWGAGDYPYLNGTVCTIEQHDAQVSTPLASWDLGGGHAPGFLTSQISSDGTTDSAAPPLPSIGPQSITPVTAGVGGFGSDADIATYAALVSRFGTGTAEQTAEVADAVIRHSTGAAAGCVDSIRENALLAQARHLAGPYTLTFTGQAPASLLPGAATPISVTLRSAAGAPVPGAVVSFGGSGLVLSAATATTDASGVATVQVQAPLGTTTRHLAVAARAALATGLVEVNGQAVPSSTDPTGAVATAVAAAAPTPVIARRTLRLNLSAHPVMHVSVPTSGLSLGGTTSPRATITGMYGHSATVTFTIRGPVPLAPGRFCADRSRADFRAAPVAATSTLTITGNSKATAGRWQPTKPGCYWAVARLVTRDAVPKATAHAAAPGPITVLDTTVAVHVRQTLVKPGDPVVGKAVAAHAYGLGGQVDVHMIGPVRPPPGASSCAAADFSSAGVATATGGTGALPNDVHNASASFAVRAGGVGCYRLAGAVDLHLPGGGRVRVPIDQSRTPHVLAVAPAVSYAMNQVWSYRRGSVSAQVTVIGTFNQPAHVTLRMMRVPDTSLVCRGANYAAALPGPTGPAVAAQANLATVAVRSGPLQEPGCYKPVPVLTMDGNHTITATGSFDALTSAVAVGNDPAQNDWLSGRASPPGQPDLAAQVGAAAAYVLLCLLALWYAVLVARRMARASMRAPNDRLLP